MFDAHVHAHPDVVPRLGDEIDLARLYRAAGFEGYVLKAHHESTVGRGAAASAHTGLNVVGGVVLNHATGGLSGDTVLAALLAGGRMVWFPTADAHTQEAAGLPRLGDQDARLSRRTLALPPVADPSPAAFIELHLILDLIAEFDAVLCTGHVSPTECRWLFEQAQRRGIRRFLLTHPSYTVPGMATNEIVEFAERGAHVELTAFQLYHQRQMTPAGLAEVAWAAGERLILASDAGQVNTPDPPHALAELQETLAAQGLDRGWLHAAADEVPRELILQ